MSFSRVQQWASFSRQWWLYDAQFQCPFRSADVVNRYLQGLHKPIFHPQSDLGDHVVVINSRHIAMEADYWRTWKYYHDTGYPGGKTETRAYQVHDKNPTEVFRRAVYSSMKGTLIRRLHMKRLHIYPDEEIPEKIRLNLCDQIRQVMPVPKRLDEYSEEERRQFPRLFEYPEDAEFQYGKNRPKTKKQNQKA